MTVPSSAPAHPVATVARGVVGALVLVVLVASIALLVTSLLGYERYVITGGSMAPGIQRGAMVLDEVVPVGSLRRGDVITFVAPGRRHPTTHRIASLQTLRGQRVLRTKGDANAAFDPWRITLPGATQARKVASVPYVGWVFITLGSPEARRWLLGLPAILIALWVLARTWRAAGRLPPRGAGVGTA